MPNPREIYLSQLRDELASRLEDHEVQVRLAEVEAHLADGIEGRCELGLDPDAAEREAIANFGPSRHLARRMIRQALARWDAARLFCIALAGIVYGIMALVGVMTWNLTAYAVGLPLILLLLAAFAVSSFGACRPAPGRIIAIGGAAVLMLWAGASILTVAVPRPEAPSGSDLYVLERWKLSGTIDETRVAIAERKADRAELDRNWKTFSGSAGIEGLRQGWGYKVPWQEQGWRGRVRYDTTNRDWAQEGWKSFYSQSAKLLATQDLERYAQKLQDAEDHPIANALKTLPGLLRVNSVVVGGAVVMDLFFGSLGAAAFRSRRKRRGAGGLVA